MEQKKEISIDELKAKSITELKAIVYDKIAKCDAHTAVIEQTRKEMQILNSIILEKQQVILDKPVEKSIKIPEVKTDVPN